MRSAMRSRYAGSMSRRTLTSPRVPQGAVSTPSRSQSSRAELTTLDDLEDGAPVAPGRGRLDQHAQGVGDAASTPDHFAHVFGRDVQLIDRVGPLLDLQHTDLLGV